MKIAISNLGPVREADIELKSLTIFVGPNNSGKSFIATVLHAALSRSPVDYAVQISRAKRAPEFEEIDSESRLAYEAFDTGKVLSYNDVAEPLRDFLRKRLLSALNAYGTGLAKELERAIGAPIHSLRRVQKNVQQRPASGWSLAVPHGRLTSLSLAEYQNLRSRRLSWNKFGATFDR